MCGIFLSKLWGLPEVNCGVDMHQITVFCLLVATEGDRFNGRDCASLVGRGSLNSGCSKLVRVRLHHIACVIRMRQYKPSVLSIWCEAIQVLRNAFSLEIGPPPTPS